jgi:hypothetical protein
MATRLGTLRQSATVFHLPERLDAAHLALLGTVADRQVGIVRRDQLREIGLSAHVVESMLVGRRWRELGPLIVALHNGPLTAHQRLWTAVLNSGEPAGLAARTAAAEQGLTGWAADVIEVLVPRGAVVSRIRGIDVKIHESRRFTAEDLHPGLALAQVRIERALIDAAAWSRSPRTACGIVAAGVQQRLTTPARLVRELECAGAVRHRRLLRSALADIDGGAQAVSELDFLRFCRRNGLPRPTLQVVRIDRTGRRRYLDATFQRRDGQVVHVEIDGALHLVVHTYWADMARGNDLAIDRRQVLRFPSYVIYANDQRAADQLRRVLTCQNLTGL